MFTTDFHYFFDTEHGQHLYSLLSMLARNRNFVTVTVLLLYFMFGPRRSVIRFVFAGIACLEVAHHFFEELNEWFSSVGWDLLAFYSWYSFFAITNIVMVIFVHLAAKKYQYPHNFISKSMLGSYVTLSIIQLSRFAEREIFETDYLAVFYQVGVVYMNWCITAMCIFGALHSLKLVTNPIRSFVWGCLFLAFCFVSFCAGWLITLQV